MFPAVWGLLDSDQDDEATAAFLQLRALQRRRGQTFRQLLERFDEAERVD